MKKINVATIISYCAVFIGAVALVTLLIFFAADGSFQNNSSDSITESGVNNGSSLSSSDTVSVKLGDTLTLGTYNRLPIKWRVIDIKDNKALVIADDIITIKAFDAAGSGKFNFIGKKDYSGSDLSELPVLTQHKLRGSNQWQLSNIRWWLNSDTETVKYADQPPTNEAMSQQKNGYDKEAGFLSDFTDAEKKAIITTSNLTDNVTTEDKVFLLSSEEVNLLKKAGVSLSAKPTENAIKQDKSGWYAEYREQYGVTDHYWWLRDNEGISGLGYENFMVSNSSEGNKIIKQTVGLEGFGIRPAMTVDLSAEIVKQNIG